MVLGEGLEPPINLRVKQAQLPLCQPSKKWCAPRESNSAYHTNQVCAYPAGLTRVRYAFAYKLEIYGNPYEMVHDSGVEPAAFTMST